MKNTKLLTAIFCIVALQACTTHNHHYPNPGNIGIAEPSKGVPGKPGKMGTLKAQRKAEIDKSLLPKSGTEVVAESGGLKGAEGRGSSPSGTAGQPQAKKEDSASFDIPFAKKAILSILQWCIVAQCGS